MKIKAKPKGTWMHRFAIRAFTLVLAVLFYWMLGFFVADVRSIPGPNYNAIETAHLDPLLLEKRTALEAEIADLGRQVANETEKQRVVGDSSRSLQQTINQLIELQKLGLEKQVAFSEGEQGNFTSSLNLFLDNQRKYQEINQTLSGLLGRKHELTREKERADQEVERQKKPARESFTALGNRHRIKLAFLQLAILLPFLAVTIVVVVRKRASIYFPMFLAFSAATLLKVALVIHEYFPTKYFKYILISGLLIAVARLLVYFIRTIAFPKADWLVRQYREAYERFLCPLCEYPIRIGPRRHLFWTRRTVNKIVVPGAGNGDPEEPYVCPCCGSVLFEECDSCHKIRHAMLPSCSHCGAERNEPTADAAR